VDTTILELITQYEKDIDPCVRIDEFNAKQVCLDLPSRRHYWVGRLMFHKQEVLKLEQLKKRARVKVAESLTSTSPVGLTSKTVSASASLHPVIQKIDGDIEQHNLVIEYLTKVESNFRSLSYDIKNLIEIQKLETT
jgi:hypothetical protein